MWRWLQNKLPKVARIWAQLCGVVLGFHIAILFCLFFVYQHTVTPLVFEIDAQTNKQAIVVFKPFGAHKKKIHSQVPPTHSSKTATCATATSKMQRNSPAIKVPTSVVSEKKVSSQKSKKKVIAAKKNPKKDGKQAKKNTARQPEKKIIKPEPTPPPQKKELPLSQPSLTTPSDDQDIRYVNQTDIDVLHVQEELYSTIVKHWKPPIGMSKSYVCTLSIVLDSNGSIQDILIEKSSDSALYDISARSAAMQTTYPNQLWGKTCTLTFKQ